MGYKRVDANFACERYVFINWSFSLAKLISFTVYVRLLTEILQHKFEEFFREI